MRDVIRSPVIPTGKKRRDDIEGLRAVATLLIAGSLWSGVIERDRQRQLKLIADLTACPGAVVHLSTELTDALPDLPVRPDTATTMKDTVVLTRDCNAVAVDTELFRCDRGSPDAEHTIALVGSSHARHWYHALEALSEKHGWHLVTMTKNACQFSAEDHLRVNGNPFWECDEWNAEAMAEIVDLQPDAVFTLGTLTRAEDDTSERVPDGFVERWRELDALGIDVIAVRDTPRFSFSVPACADQNEPDTCTEEKAKSMSETPPYAERSNQPGNTAFLDMTDYLCPDGVCSGVIGNQLVFYDSSHFTYTFSESLAVPMEPHLLEALGLPPGETVTGR
ncbi:SGNH hydrolase domain-containing protein [Nocardiopsis valliformis]|uniref:SGNH hydrolase domain-containing protein n=1 Tax=Nocardiopsis valliformis TaxID=239974 RepID=UPI00126819EE|nr:SGNH hydrolase domain-containing protein [Nocardiopsis valliformis]